MKLCLFVKQLQLIIKCIHIFYTTNNFFINLLHFVHFFRIINVIILLLVFIFIYQVNIYIYIYIYIYIHIHTYIP